MDMTDDHIKLLQVSAVVNDGIRLCRQTLGELAEQDARSRLIRQRCESFLGELLAHQLMLEHAQDRLQKGS